ncbi:DUF4835 domain-containing protein [Chitinophaga parva]|uniref:DUF4835 domain-containing protein n=1 Tax=Chitinophaga parva TaxID=2169414 RepID=A0A2T7BNM5_9BACT|nr:DUF4835 family protein [Chitinophaga parva]PUZ29221.1 DUF4835 domain-containing protein [Chitinophaga parva]
MHKPLHTLLAAILILTGFSASAQELRATVNVVASSVQNTTDKRVYNTLQSAIKDFLNNRRWSDDAFAPAERIECNFLLNITAEVSSGTYRANLTVQATRPVYNTNYTSTLFNFQDNNVVFKYAEFQSLEFSDTRVAGSDPMAANLTAVLAYYVDVILGLDYDSFSPRGGDPFFKKALNIVNNAPDGKDIAGWKAFEGNRNRYWLIDNLTNVKFARFHDVMYQYHRQGLDVMYDDAARGRGAIINCVNMLAAINDDVPNSMLLQVFFLAKNEEVFRIFNRATPQEKGRVSQLLASMDVPNANKYLQLK